MKARVAALQKSITSFFKSSNRPRKYATSPPAGRCDAHMNELPVPCGPWEVHYNDNQAFFAKWLVTGIVWFGLSLGTMIYTESLPLNWGPPCEPDPPTPMAPVECESIDD